MFESSLIAWAQWINAHGTALTVAVAALALVVEASQRSAVGVSRHGTRSEWRASWFTNVGLLLCALALSWVVAPLLSPWFSSALSGEHGVLAMVELPYALRVLLGVLLLDFIGYVAHWLFHRVPWLWRVHQVHHSDTAMNASTHFRQHPLQLLALALVQLPLLYVLGIPAVSWLLLVPIALVLQTWQHAALPGARAALPLLAWLLVTPALHRVHHHPERQWHDHNYGNVFSFWDRLFGTLVLPATSAPTTRVDTVGLADWPASQSRGFWRTLAMPFLRPAAINSRSDTPTPRPKSRHRSMQDRPS